MKIALEKVVLLEAAYKPLVDHLGTPEASAGKPPSDVQIEVDVFEGEDPDTHAVKLRVHVESKGSPYSVTVVYATMLKLIRESEERIPDNLGDRIMVTGASMAFPFVRELILNMTSRGRFAGVTLNPVNFNTLVPKMKSEATLVPANP